MYTYVYYVYTCHDDIYSEVVLQVVIIYRIIINNRLDSKQHLVTIFVQHKLHKHKQHLICGEVMIKFTRDPCHMYVYVYI